MDYIIQYSEFQIDRGFSSTVYPQRIAYADLPKFRQMEAPLFDATNRPQDIQSRHVSNVVPRPGSKPFAVVAIAATLALSTALGGEAEAQILGTAADFGVLAGSTVTNTGSSVIQGNVGVSPGSAIVGFPPGIVVAPGTIHAGDAVAAQAQADLTTAYNTLMAMPTQVTLTGQNLGGLTLGPAVYSFATSAQLTGLLTLNGQGNSAAQFVFKIGSTLTTASNSAVLLINGANGNNVYWAVGSSATLGTNTVFAGNIVALTSITLNTGATITCGRALARNGAVTLDSNTITLCAPGAAIGGGPGGGGPNISMAGLFGEGVAGAQQTAFGASSLFGSAMLAQGAFWREGSGQDLSGVTPQNLRSLKDGPVEDAADGLVIDGYQPRTWRLWTTALGSTGSLRGDADIGSSNLFMRTAGFAVGLDLQIDRTALVGIAGGYTISQFSANEGMTSGTVEGGHVGLYAVKRFGPLYVAATAEYAHFSNATNRAVDFVVTERATGEFATDAYSARIEAGWKRFFYGHWLTPFAGLQVSHLESQGFTEQSNGILGLTFASRSATSLQTSLGMQLDRRIVFSNGQTLTPFARAAWVHEFDPDRSVDAFLTLSPAAAFTANGASAASDLARVTTGLKLDVTQHVALFTYFGGEFSGQGQSYSGTGGIKISW
jgi:outer membrane autotransporter protein